MARPPARSHQEPGRRPTYLTAAAGHLGHNRGPKRSREQPILSRAWLGAPRRAFQNRTRRLRGPISGHRGVRGVFWLLPLPPPASKPKCEDSRVQSETEQQRGACPPSSLPSAPGRSCVSLGGAPLSLTSVPGRTRFCWLWTGAGPHSCPGLRQRRALQCTRDRCPLPWAQGLCAPRRFPAACGPQQTDLQLLMLASPVLTFWFQLWGTEMDSKCGGRTVGFKARMS